MNLEFFGLRAPRRLAADQRDASCTTDTCVVVAWTYASSKAASAPIAPTVRPKATIATAATAHRLRRVVSLRFSIMVMAALLFTHPARNKRHLWFQMQPFP